LVGGPGAIATLVLARDPEKWEPAFPRDKRESVCAQIMLKQRDEIMMRFHLIAS
jgi:hypothetical protein